MGKIGTLFSSQITHDGLRITTAFPFPVSSLMTTQIACITVCPYAKCTSHTVIVVSSMELYREELWVETKNRRAYMNITPQVEAVVRNSRIKDGPRWDARGPWYFLTGPKRL